MRSESGRRNVSFPLSSRPRDFPETERRNPSISNNALHFVVRPKELTFLSHSSNKQIPSFFLPSLTFLPPKDSQLQIPDRQNQISIAIHLPYSSRSKKNRQSFRADAVYSKRESRSLLLVVGKGILEIRTSICAEFEW